MPKVKQNAAVPVEINYSKKLPDAEFVVMAAIWAGTPPVNTAYLMDAVGRERGWKAPTLISFLVRLEERGYISSTKQGKERFYMPVAEESKYMQTITADFVEQYHGGSFVHLMDTLRHSSALSVKKFSADTRSWSFLITPIQIATMPTVTYADTLEN